MTCEEFREVNEGGVERILSLTRAERSAAAKHWVDCYECREWTNTFNLSMTPTQLAEVEEARRADRRDPEAYHPTPKEADPERYDLDVPVERRQGCRNQQT